MVLKKKTKLVHMGYGQATQQHLVNNTMANNKQGFYHTSLAEVNGKCDHRNIRINYND